MNDVTKVLDTYRQRGLHTDERVGWVLTRAADSWPDREAILFQGQRLTWRQMWRWVTVVASDLVAAGISPGDRILWQLPNCLEGLVLHLAGWRIGAVCVPVVPLYREHEMAHILGQTRPAVVAFAGSLGGRRPAAEMGVLLESLGLNPSLRYAVGEGQEGWATLRSQPSAEEPVDDSDLPDPAPADRCCLILYTSGTTSAPKGAMHASRSLIAEASTWRAACGLSGTDVFLMGAPITHITGLLIAIVVPAALGARTVLMAKWDPDEAVGLCEQERATFCGGATIFLQGFVERYERGMSPSHRVVQFMCGGAAVPPSLIERADRVGIRAYRVWGMTEAPTTTLCPLDAPLEYRAFRDGKASEGTEIQAVDEARRPLPAGELGELRVRSPEQMLGYTDPVIDAAQVDDQGWFYTGDVGTVTADGWVQMAGRTKDIVNRGGEKFSSQDIERVVASHPHIASVAVLGVPDDKFGEKVAAFVTLQPGSAWPGRESLFRHLEAAKMAKQKFPVVIRILDELPMTLSGKVQKHMLLDLWDRELSTQPEPA